MDGTSNVKFFDVPGISVFSVNHVVFQFKTELTICHMVSTFANRNLTTNRKNHNFGYGLVFFGSVSGFGSVMCSPTAAAPLAAPKRRRLGTAGAAQVLLAAAAAAKPPASAKPKRQAGRKIRASAAAAAAAASTAPVPGAGTERYELSNSKLSSVHRARPRRAEFAILISNL